MRTAIQVRNSDLTNDLREYVEHRLAFALSQFPEHIRGVVVVLSGINGPKGGIDKRCSLRVRLIGRSDFVIEETEADFHVAVDRAADRAKRTLGRRLQRLRNTFSERAS